MIIKIFAFSAILLLSLLLGIAKACELSCSYSNLKSLIDAISMLESVIKTKNSELYEAFIECSASDKTGIFREIAAISEKDGDFLKLRGTIYSKINDANARNALMSFVNGLKVEDTKGQLANIKMCLDRLVFAYNDIGSSIEKMRKIYIMSFVLSGIAVSILFI